MREMTNASVALAGVIALLGITPPVQAGGLTFLEAKSDTDIDRAANLTASGDGVNVYVAGERHDAVAVYVRQAHVPFGPLTLAQVVNDGIGGVDGLESPADVAVSPDLDCVYVVGERDDAVAVFDRTPFTGLLTFVEAEFDGLGGVTDMRRPAGVAVSSDSAHVYVTSPTDDALVAFERTAGCALAFVESQVDGQNGVDGLQRPRGVAVSADGASVYTAGGSSVENDDAVAVFSRDAGTGALTFLEFHLDGANGVEGIASGHGIALSPDDAHVYVAGADDNSVAIFGRTTAPGPDLGRLTFLERVRDGGGIDGLKGVTDVAVSKTGAYVYAVGRDEDALAVFRRDPASGRLAFLEVHKDGDDGVGGMQGPGGVVAMPDVLFENRNVYVAARRGLQSQEGAVVGFTADYCSNGTLGADEQCDDGGFANGDGCSSTCQLELCGSTPAAGCRTTVLPGKSLLKIKENANDNKDKFQWKWNKGETTTLADYDDPATTDDYVVCVYDSSAAPQPLLQLSAPAGGTCNGKPCWDAKSNKFKYKDKDATPDGLEKGQLKEGLVDGKAKIQLKGKGANLYFPLGGDVLGPSGLTLPVTVQVTNTETGTPICWESVHSIAQRNDADQFTSRGD